MIDESGVGEVDEEPEREQAQAGGNRQALIQAAYARIATEGFEGLRTRDVAADAGVNIGTLHYYFPSKEALIRAAAQHMFQQFFATLSDAGAPLDPLRRHLDALRHLLKTDQTLWAVGSEVALRAARDSIIADMLHQSEDGWYGFLHGQLVQGIAAGILDASLQPEDAAVTLMAAIKGLSMPWPGAFRPGQIDQTFEQLQRWLGLSAATTSPEPRES